MNTHCQKFRRSKIIFFVFIFLLLEEEDKKREDEENEEREEEEEEENKEREEEEDEEDEEQQEEEIEEQEEDEQLKIFVCLYDSFWHRGHGGHFTIANDLNFMTISEIFTVLQPEGHMVSEAVHLGIFFGGGGFEFGWHHLGM